MKRFSSWLCALLVALALWLPAGLAQTPPANPPTQPAPQTTTPAPSQPSGPTEPPPPALAWGVAAVFCLVILVILCAPSRKG